jgi:hypothetical protein
MDGFVVSVCWCLGFLLILRVFTPFFVKLLRPPPFRGEITQESTIWLNFILQQVVGRLRHGPILTELNKSHSTVHIHSVRSAPIIPYVATVKMQHPDDVRLLIPLRWTDGPSVDIALSPSWTIEIDLRRIQCRVIVTWPADNPAIVEVRFDREFALECDFAVRFTKGWGISLSGIPLIGPIATAWSVAFLAQKTFVLPLPRPEPPTE